MTTSSVIVDDPGPKKNKNDLGHIMISYNHSTRLLCMKIAHCLRVMTIILRIEYHLETDLSRLLLGSGLSRLDRS